MQIFIFALTRTGTITNNFSYYDDIDALEEHEDRGREGDEMVSNSVSNSFQFQL